MANTPLRSRMSKRKIEYADHLRRNPTASEAELWKALRKKKTGVRFTRSACMLGYIADFYCHKHRLVVELDGSSHNGREEYDKLRDQVMNKYGMTVLRINASRVFTDLKGVLEDIQRAVRQRLVVGFPLTISD